MIDAGEMPSDETRDDCMLMGAAVLTVAASDALPSMVMVTTTTVSVTSGVATDTGWPRALPTELVSALVSIAA